jgi:HEAT repeat protein
MSRLLSLSCCLTVLFVPAIVARQPQANRVAALIGKLGDDSFEARRQARLELENVGDAATDGLIEAMTTGEDLEMRLAARQVLTRICEAKADRLIECLADRQAPSRAAAVKELTKLVDARQTAIQQAAAKRRLSRAAVGHGNVAIRKEAEAFLYRLYHARVAALIDDLGDDVFNVREAATFALLQIGPPRPGPAEGSAETPRPGDPRPRTPVSRVSGAEPLRLILW